MIATTARHRRTWVAWMTAALLAALASGCGPTGGGTGGGSAFTLSSFGAKSADVCQSTVADTLACPTVSVAGAQTAGHPAWSGELAGQRVRLLLSGNDAQLQHGCHAGEFEGAWGVLPDGTSRYFGGYRSSPDGGEVAATLELNSGSDGLTLVATVRDTQGAMLLGPVLLTVGSAPGTPGTCP